MKTITDENKINEVLTRGVEDLIEKEHIKKALFSGESLRVKFGIDPTAPDLHLGHAVALRKLKQFQDLGHQIIFLIGDFTAKIGDPTGKDEARKPLTDDDVKNNLENYLKHAKKILDIEKTEVVYNNKWYSSEGIASLMRLASAGSIQQMLERSDFKKRLEKGKSITLLETLYPLFQGYDSVKVRADVEIGGTDQLFNLLMGRRVQKHYEMPEQDVLTVPILEGTDGVKKMSKSVGNYISLDEKPFSMFEKVMLVPDMLITKYFSLCTDVKEDEIKNIEERLKNENPKDIKLELAEEIVKIYHSEGDAKKAREEFVNVFSKKEKPKEAEEFKISKKEITIVELLAKTKLAKSNSDARRLIDQGGVKIDKEVKKDTKEVLNLKGGEILQVGKRRFLKIKV